MAKSSKKPAAVTSRWAIVLRGGSFRLLPYADAKPEEILCHCAEGDREWTRVGSFVSVLKGHRNPDAVPMPWEIDDPSIKEETAA